MKKKVAFLILTATALIISYLLAQDFSEGLVNDYYKNIIILIGINISLATSLNLINGFTGQFSLGHAGFMAVGGYFSITIAIYLEKEYLAKQLPLLFCCSFPDVPRLWLAW